QSRDDFSSRAKRRVVARHLRLETRDRLPPELREVEPFWPLATFVREPRAVHARDAVAAHIAPDRRDQVPHAPLRHKSERINQTLEGRVVAAAPVREVKFSPLPYGLLNRAEVRCGFLRAAPR